MDNNTLFLGVSREVITPKVGCNLYGYDPNLYSTCVNDDLTATAYYFKQGDLQVIILNLTLCSLNSDITKKLIQSISNATKIDASNVIVHTNHTHSGPNTAGSSGWGDVDNSYVDEILFSKSIKACYDATLNPTPVKMGVHTIKSLVGINRRQLNENGKVKLGQNSQGVFDPDMTVISFVDYDSKCVGNMIHYGCHATASGLNTEITRDWPGPMIDKLEDESGGLTAFFNGPEGDVGPRLKNGKTTGDRSVKYALELGEIALNDAFTAYKNITNYTIPKLNVKKYKVKLPFDKRIPLKQAIAGYNEFKNRPENIYVAQCTYYQSVINSYQNGYVESDGVYFEQPILTLGDVALVGFPHELFSDIGIKIKEQKIYKNTLVLALTNGSNGYFPSKDQMCLGGYEVLMFKTKFVQPISEDADESAVTQTINNLKDIKGEQLCIE